MLIDRSLPGEEFIDRQGVAVAGVSQGEQYTAHGRDHQGLARDGPVLLRTRWRQISNRQWAAVRALQVVNPRSKGVKHRYSFIRAIALGWPAGWQHAIQYIRAPSPTGRPYGPR